MSYEQSTYSLLKPVLGVKLTLKSDKTGIIYKATDEQTLLIKGSTSNIDIKDKYRNTIKSTAYDPINPKIKIDNGCSECGRKVVSYQLLGEHRTAVYVCLCGALWV